MARAPLLVDVTAAAAKHTGVARWIEGFCAHLRSRGIPFQTTSACDWAAQLGPIRQRALRTSVLRDLIYYSRVLPRLSAQYERVVILDNVARLVAPLPATARPFYLIHDIIPLEMSDTFVLQTAGARAALLWKLTRRIYRWRFRRVVFATGARFGCISKATQASMERTFGSMANRGEWIGPMMLRIANSDDSNCDGRIASLAMQQPYVLALGTGDPKKGLESLLNAWQRTAIDDHLRLILFGDAWQARAGSAMRRKLRELEASNIVHVGGVCDVTLQFLYRHAKAFVFPSRFEGLGLPPAEYAEAGGGELILRDIPSLREIYGDVARFFATDEELIALLKALPDSRAPLISPELRRETLRRRLDSSATFDRLCTAIME